MREIKFRAWDQQEMRMYRVGLLDCQRMQIVPPTPDEEAVLTRHDDIELMQFTNLKDKNGKEIYEGDLVGEPGFYFPVTYFDAAFHIGNSQPLIEWLHARSRRGEDTEVIGNIHENPELLNG